MKRLLLSLITVIVAESGIALAADADIVTVLPFHTVGVSEETARSAREILIQELLGRGLQGSFPVDSDVQGPGPDACHNPRCAADIGTGLGADRVLFASLLQLGDKIVVNVNAVNCTSRSVIFADNLSALTIEDLDTIMRRVAGSFASGKSTSTPSVTTVTADETLEPRRQASRGRVEFRGGFLYPAGASYGRADRLTSLNLVYVRETKDFLVETTALTGAAWGDGSIEWTPFDVFLARVLGEGDFSPYFGAGVGVRVLNVEGYRTSNEPDVYGYPYYGYPSQSATTMSLDVGTGFMALRTFDVSLRFEVRYHVVLEDFEQIGGKGAHGLSLSFGTGF